MLSKLYSFVGRNRKKTNKFIAWMCIFFYSFETGLITQNLIISQNLQSEAINTEKNRYRKAKEQFQRCNEDVALLGLHVLYLHIGCRSIVLLCIEISISAYFVNYRICEKMFSIFWYIFNKDLSTPLFRTFIMYFC